MTFNLLVFGAVAEKQRKRSLNEEISHNRHVSTMPTIRLSVTEEQVAEINQRCGNTKTLIARLWYVTLVSTSFVDLTKAEKCTSWSRGSKKMVFLESKQLTHTTHPTTPSIIAACSCSQL